MRKICLFILITTGVLLLLAESGLPIPAFARKYGFNCNMCHTAFTKLNDYGQRIRDNGYQLPGQEGLEKNVFQTALPISLRTSVGMLVSHNAGPKTTTDGFNINGLDLLAAGVLHKNVSFLIIYTPRIDEPAGDYTGNDDSSNPSQMGALESANIVFSNLVPGLLNVRVGKFEPAYHPFSSKRSYYLLQPYEVYTFTTPNNGFVFDDNQMGIEAIGHLKNGFKYGFGVVNGSGANPDNNNAKDFYANVYQTFGRGDGQSAGQRIGAFGYLGWQPRTFYEDHVVAPSGEIDGKDNKTFYRVGGDVSLNWKTFNLMFLMMYGVDDKALNDIDSTEDYNYTGGFGRLDWAGLMNNRLVASALFNWVTPPEYDEERTITAFTGLLRYYLGDWTAVNVALHAEYTFRKVGKDDPDKQHQFAMLLDFDF